MRNMSLRKKFTILLICCVLVPVLSLDILIIYVARTNEIKRHTSENRAIAKRVYENVKEKIDTLIDYANYIFTDVATYEFLYHNYEYDNQYYHQFLKYSQNFEYKSMNVFETIKNATFYTTNPTVINGAYVHNIREVSNSSWYQSFEKSGLRQLVSCYWEHRPHIDVLTKLDYYIKGLTYDCNVNPNVAILRLELDLDSLTQDMHDIAGKETVFLCYNDQIILENMGDAYLYQPVSIALDDYTAEGTVKYVSGSGDCWSVYAVFKTGIVWGEMVGENRIVFVIILFNLIIPILLMYQIEFDITRRLFLLESRFHIYQLEYPQLLEGDHGKDEIGRLIKYYNSYVVKMNEMRGRLEKREQEKVALEISRKQAEINSLIRQSNPHFLYNTLESICMRSVIKKEYETADIIRKLSGLIKEQASWKKDTKKLYEEVEFIQKYLEIQKYRFGDKLNYQINVEGGCKELEIPKLSLVSLVENACVHGIEDSLEDGTIQVIADMIHGNYRIMIIDNGSGMKQEKVDEIRTQLNQVNLDNYQTFQGSGLLNSYLRLQFLFGSRLDFQFESKEDEGTKITIIIRGEGELC